jgi:hypothetical protein
MEEHSIRIPNIDSILKLHDIRIITGQGNKHHPHGFINLHDTLIGKDSIQMISIEPGRKFKYFKGDSVFINLPDFPEMIQGCEKGKKIIKIMANDKDSVIVKICKDEGDENVQTRIIIDKNGKYTKSVNKYKSNVKIEDLNNEDLKNLKKSTKVAPTNDLEIEDLNFYPNPNSGKFDVSFHLPEKGLTEVTIYNMTGKPVYSETLPFFQGDYIRKINISKESKGMYMVKIQQGDKMITKKIILE